MKVVSFACPGCSQAVAIQYVGVKNTEFLFIAHCDVCDKQLNFPADKVYSELMDTNFVPCNKRMN